MYNELHRRKIIYGARARSIVSAGIKKDDGFTFRNNEYSDRMKTRGVVMEKVFTVKFSKIHYLNATF